MASQIEKTEQALAGNVAQTEQALAALDDVFEGRGSADESVLPEGWAECLVGDYLFLKNGYAFKSNMYTEKSDGTFPIIRISDVDGRVASDAKAIHVNSDDVVDGFEVCDGDLLIAMSGATTGKVGIYKGALAYQNQRVGNIKLHSDELGNKVYKNYLIANLTPDILKAAYGGAQPNISGKAIEGIKIPLPPLAEQTVIAQTLDTLLAQVDNIKTRLDAIPKILKTFRQSVLAAAVSGKLTDVKPLKETNISDVARVIGGLTKNSKRKNLPKKLPYLRVANVYANELRLDDMAEVGVEDKELERLLLKDKDILVVEGNGSIDQIGRAAIWNDEVKPCVHQNHLIKIRCNQEIISQNFLLMYLISPQGRKEIVAKATSGAGLFTLSISKISSVNLPLYLLEEQTEIVRRVEELFAFADQIEQQVKNAQGRVNNLTQSILAKAFRGELTAQWRAENPDSITGDNSAEALLAKIKLEREALKQKTKPKKKTALKKSVNKK